MYKGASQNNQTRLDRGVYRDAQGISGRDEKLTDIERERLYKRAISDVESKILLHPPGSAARKLYAKQKNKLQIERTAYLSAKNGTAHSADWNAIWCVYRKKVAESIGKELSDQFLSEAQHAYAASRGLTFDQAFNKPVAA